MEEEVAIREFCLLQAISLMKGTANPPKDVIELSKVLFIYVTTGQ